MIPDAYPCDIDELSGSSVVERHCGRPLVVELTFRQLAEYCRKEMEQMDSLTPRTRLAIQRANDPHYSERIERRRLSRADRATLSVARGRDAVQ
ncbi:MAG: hypothetical protein ACOY4R_27650 [Pseudomonadota bacterium]